MRAVISGISGLIGSRFFEKYSDKFEKIYQLGRTRVDIDAEWIKYDLSTGFELAIPDVDVLFHFSSQTSSNYAREDVLYDLNVNVVGTIQLLQALRKITNKPFVVLAGSATEYGYTSQSLPVDEEYCSNPITFYDISKLTAERYLLQYVREGWVDGCVLRLCNVYGGSKDGQNDDRGIIDKFFQKAIKGEPLTIYGSGDFLRDYIHVDDVVSAFFLAWKYREQTNGKYFNIGTGIGTTVKEAFNLIAKLGENITGNRVEVLSVEPPISLSQIEYRSFIADNVKFVRLTNWNPIFGLETGIRSSYSNIFLNINEND